MKSLYLILNLATISVPLIRSFEPRIAFFRKWKALFSAIAVTAAFFLIWDAIFTAMGVWGFNDRYLLGIRLFDLPVGEWLFFITVPYACLFIYECLLYFIPKDPLANVYRILGFLFMGLGIGAAVVFYDQWYTMTTGLVLAGLLAVNLFWLKSKWLGRFFLAYAVCLIPFFMVNGVLTGTGIEEQVVWYNDGENLGLRLWTIPVEDAFYGMALILMNVTLYEHWLGRDNAENA
ncbi:MAG: lycopene cyclase domain-containing protein [Bacteroidota bacterium]